MYIEKNKNEMIFFNNKKFYIFEAKNEEYLIDRFHVYDFQSSYSFSS